MSSLRKIESARANGARSRGPKTDEGKKQSSQNALKHGLAGSTVVLKSIEDQARFASLRQTYLTHLQPKGPIELDLVEQMVHAKWRQERAWGIESTLLEIEMDLNEEEIQKRFDNPDNPLRLALAFDSLAGEARALVHLNRYESRLRRQYERALHDLRRIQAERNLPQPPTTPRSPKIVPNEPNPTNGHPVNPESPANSARAFSPSEIGTCSVGVRTHHNSSLVASPTDAAASSQSDLRSSSLAGENVPVILRRVHPVGSKPDFDNSLLKSVVL